MPFLLLLLLGGAYLAWTSRMPDSAAITATSTHYGISLELATAVHAVAEAIGADPAHLAAVIHFESAGKWSSNVRHPTSGATGLIQFMPRTATRLGTTTDALAQLSPVAQMAWVQKYFEAVKAGQWPDDPKPGPLDTLQAVAMAVFYPPARFTAPTAPFPASVQANNPGIATPGDYLARLRNFQPAAVRGAL